MNNVAYNDNEKCALNSSSGEAKQKGQTDYHAGDGVGDKSNPLNNILKLLIYGASGSDQSGAVGSQSTENGRDNSGKQGVFTYTEQGVVCKYSGHVL